MLLSMNEADRVYDFDVAILGAGSGGFAAARTAAGHGLKVAVIEGGEEVGGLCILRGCMPTKALLYAAEVMHLARAAGTWGIRTEDVSFNFAQVMARKNAMIKDFADYRVQPAQQRQVQVHPRAGRVPRSPHRRVEHGRTVDRGAFRDRPPGRGWRLSRCHNLQSWIA